MKKLITLVLIGTCTLSHSQSLDAYINDSTANTFVRINTLGTNGVFKPNDLDFNLNETNSSMELWVVNEGNVNSGGSTVTFLNAGEANQTHMIRKDGNAWHFMAMPSAIAFNEVGDWANSADIYSANRSSVPFTGPSLWSSDMSIYGVIGNPPTSQSNGSHLDMLHQSPYGMGIASDTMNIFWLFDGHNSTIVKYDFVQDHGPGNDYHGDGKVHYYNDVNVSRIAGLPSHLVLDQSDKMLYICDNGNSRILRLDSRSGTKKADMNFNLEFLAERWEMKDAVVDTLNTNLVRPCGIDVYGDRMVVSENLSGHIVIYDISNTPNITEIGRIKVPHLPHDIRGVKVGPKGRIWYVNYDDNGVYYIANSGVLSLDNPTNDETFAIYPNPGKGSFSLSIRDDFKGSINVLDISGKTIYRAATSNTQRTFDVSSIDAGMYWIQLVDDKGRFVSSQKWINLN